MEHCVCAKAILKQGGILFPDRLLDISSKRAAFGYRQFNEALIKTATIV